MFAHRSRGLFLLYAGAQSAVVFALFWAWIAVVFSVLLRGAAPAWEHYALFSVMLLGGLFFDTLRTLERSQDVLECDLRVATRVSFQKTLVVLGALLLFLFATKNQVISRVFLFSFVPVLYAVLFATSYFLPGFLSAIVFQGERVQNTLILGPSRKARRLTQWLRKKAHFGIRAVGLVSDEECPEELESVPWLGSTEEIEEVIRRTDARQVVMVDLPTAAEVRRITEVCERNGVRFMALHDLDERLCQQSATLIQDDGLYFVALHKEPLESPANRLFKRAFDLAIALPVVMFILPVAALAVWMIHRRQSPGPLFVRQERHGLQNSVFRIWKFRTMHMNHGMEARQATKGDSRIFPGGAWLRQHSVDELPQFLNVLSGEMSVVGPRPHLIQHNEEFSQEVRRYHLRSFVKPGITGLAQVRAHRGEIRSMDDIMNRVECDIEYLENWSLASDFKIVGQTALQVVATPRTAY